jgi:hypothetical protein
MPHTCKFIPAKRVMRLEMAFAVKMGQDGALNASNSGTEDLITEWRCETCLRLVKTAEVPTYGIDEVFDREEAKRRAAEEPPVKTVADIDELEHDPPLAGALSPEEQAKLLREAEAG